VGPNGCGKSNVVDAIRWVLGEQSPKHLRGESMEDVIFNGNERLAPTGMAQVSLTFENEPGASPPGAHVPTDLDLDVSTLPAHFRDLAEITVTRRYFRSGESEYFINKMPCRLKDITELFLGTGVGTKAYAIIEQGRVEQLINAKPEDRRLFIEEAAGTTLYRSRKLQAERKMERTRENLLRVNDVLREIERQIQYLHRMAKKAEQYRVLQEEIRQLDLSLCGVQWRRLTAAIGELEAALGRHREEENSALAALAKLEAERPQKLAAHVGAEDQLARQREAAAVLESECRSLQQQIELLSQEVAERERRVNRLQSETDALAAQHAQLRQALHEQERERLQCAQLLLFDEGELERKEAELVQVRARVVEATAHLEAVKNGVVGLAAREAECRNALATHQRRRDDARRRLERLAAEQAQASERLAALDSTAVAQRDAVAQLHERLRSAAGEQERRAEGVRALAERRRASERQVSTIHTQLLQLRSRLESLQQLQQSYEGYQRGVRSILLDAQPHEGVLGVVADVIGVPAQYECAVAAALGDSLQYVIVRQEDDGLGAVATLRDRDSGRGSFIPLAPRKVPLNGNGKGAHSLNGNTRPLLDLVEFEEPYRRVAEALLDEVVLVPDLASGLALWRQNGVHVTMVTPEGDLIDATGVITGGSERPLEEEIVSRRRLVGELEAEIVATEQRLAQAQADVRRLQAEMDEQEKALKDLDRDVHALTVDLVAAEKDIEHVESERPRWMDRLEVARFEAATASAEESESCAAIEQVERGLAEAALERQVRESELRSAQDGAATAAVQIDVVTAEVTRIKVNVAERRQRHEASVAALARLNVQVDEQSNRQTTIAAELQETEHERASLQTGVTEAQGRLTSQAAERQAVEGHIGVARTALDAATEALLAHDRLQHELRDQLDASRTASSQCEISLAEQRLRATHLTQSMQEKYGADLAEQPPVEGTEQEEEALARLETLREKLSRIGEVNVGAIDELRELEERATFLRTQKEDIERSLADLERTIQRLNRASRTKFAETFAAVNEKFQVVLPRLFRGGEARLVLTDEHNLLETGVDIVVRPPGKRLDTVTLLSGGEKALVAVSLIFSLFLINPTPFCFLDEVDAPLDDANISRFTHLVQEMSEHSQFIVITHNKRTMQAANVLYGVTMEEPGVSKILSVAMR
jgi:chromosome segregation protein